MAEQVEKVTLSNGQQMPLVGLGTWSAPKGVVGEAIKQAIDIGYRSFDFSPGYQNEKEIGVALSEAISSGKVKRSDLFLTSKLWSTHHHPSHVRGGLKQTLQDLRVDYLDLFLIHWPIAYEFTGYDLATAPLFPKGENGRMKFDKVPTQDTWREMEKLVDDGLVKTIGISNFTIRETLDLLAYARIRPAVNQFEVSPLHTREHLVEFMKAEGIHVTSFSTFGSSTTSASVLQIPSILELAKKYNKTPAQIVVRWVTQQGISTIPKSTNQQRLKENLSVFDFKLEEDDIKLISKENKNQTAFQPDFLIPAFGFNVWA
jgi:diketogulonate reductase-like aldo/keto reductase